MKRTLQAAAILALIGVIASLPACGSSVAQQPEITKAQFDALVLRVNDLDTAVDTVERNQGPRIGAIDKRNARIGQYHDIAWDGPGCTGNPYLYKIPASVAQQGFVFMTRLASDITGEESPYMMAAPESTLTDFNWVSTGFDDSCDDRTGAIAFQGYPMLRNDEAVCSVPDLGIPAQMWPNGTVNATMVEVYTASSCLTLVPASVLPRVLVGID